LISRRRRQVGLGRLGEREEDTSLRAPFPVRFPVRRSRSFTLHKIFDLRLRENYPFLTAGFPVYNFRVMNEDCAVPHSQVTELVMRWRDGDLAALEQLVPLVYDELRKLARSHLRRESADLNVQSPSLVHEAYLRLAGKSPPNLQNRTNFFGLRHI
jgi:hypothetical protein